MGKIWNRVLLLPLVVVIFVSNLLIPSPALAQTNEDPTPPQEELLVGKVETIFQEGEKENFGIKSIYQVVNVTLTQGKQQGKTIRINHGEVFTVSPEQKVRLGDTVVVSELPKPDGTKEYTIIDTYRLDKILLFVLAFFACVVALGRWKGLGSIAGLAISFAVIMWFIVPQIVNGQDPVIISIIGSLCILATTMYLAHGISKKTTIALIATFLTLVITAVLAWVFVNVSKLTGLGSEEAYSLRLGQIPFNYKGLLLGGMIIGALGVLDDITTGQSAVVFELAHANKNFSMKELVDKGLNVGREHISSLVNTLVLAYAGASLPIFLFFVINPTKEPLWFILNSEFVAEEIVRTISGSFGLILAVPITTILSAWMVKR